MPCVQRQYVSFLLFIIHNIHNIYLGTSVLRTVLNLPNGIVQLAPGRECSLTGWKEKETQ